MTTWDVWRGEFRWFTAAEPESVSVATGRCRARIVKVTAVRTRYEHIAAGWRRATTERRAGLLGELEFTLSDAICGDDP